MLKQGHAVALTPRELEMLLVMASHPGRVFSREELIARALGDDFDGFDRTVDAHVKNLRQKIETDPARALLYRHRARAGLPLQRKRRAMSPRP